MNWIPSNSYTGRRTEDVIEAMTKEPERMLAYFKSVPRGTYYQDQLQLQKLWGSRKEETPAKIKEFAKSHGLRVEDRGKGTWQFTK